MWEKYFRAGQAMTMRRMRISCWKPKATNTHTVDVIFIAFRTAKTAMRTPLNIALFAHCLSGIFSASHNTRCVQKKTEHLL